jgi:head-tail adaptor
MNPGALRHYVRLDDPVEDGTPVVFNPDYVWASILPAAPGAFDENKTTHIVTMRYHPQVTFNTRILHRDRQLFVRGIQNVEERNLELVLLCEEVKTP